MRRIQNIAIYTSLTLGLLMAAINSFGQANTITSGNQGITLNPGGTINYCIHDAVDLLTGNHPNIRPFSGKGITDNGDNTASFDPAAAVAAAAPAPSPESEGIFTITYNTNTYTFVVIGAVAPTLDPIDPNSYCSNDNIDYLISGGAPAGGTYYVNGNPAVTFNPSVLGTGIHTIIYQVGSGACIAYSDPQTFNVVLAPPSLLTNPPRFAGKMIQLTLPCTFLQQVVLSRVLG
ncbi:MAG: hypothetical protein RBT74_01245 [Tenuifilaceae bacterium]|nr:hypothetical protein [Tenuifilaceae bacterium]